MSFGQRNLDREKPEIDFPEGDAPTELVITDLLGMKVGGRRRLEIPADMAYGDRGAGSVIKPGESLIFVVDLLDVR